MTTLGNPKNITEIIQRYQFASQKRFSQNFLIDTRTLDKVISATGITEGDCVLEIGPGISTITQYLVEYAGKVVTVEIDTSLLPILDETLKGYPNVMVINNDILRLDMNELVDGYNSERPVKVATNLPYYITAPIIIGLPGSNVPTDNITVMVQGEVVGRMQVGPGSKGYDALSLTVQYYAKPYIVANVPPNCLIPRPNMGSAVIHLTRYQESPVQVDEPGIMFHLIRASFSQHRKMLQDRLNNSPEVPYTKEQIASAIENLGVPALIRGEALTLEQFASLANYFTRTAGKEANGSQCGAGSAKTGARCISRGQRGITLEERLSELSGKLYIEQKGR